jgi:hypothetical protein
VADLERRQVQDLIERMIEEGLAGSTVRNAMLPLRTSAGVLTTGREFRRIRRGI